MLSRENAVCMENIWQRKSNQEHNFLLSEERFTPKGHVKFKVCPQYAFPSLALLSLLGGTSSLECFNGSVWLACVFPELNKSTFILHGKKEHISWQPNIIVPLGTVLYPKSLSILSPKEEKFNSAIPLSTPCDPFYWTSKCKTGQQSSY